MSPTSSASGKKPMDPLLKNQLIGGTCAALVVVFAAIRIFVLGASADGVFTNLISVANAVLSLVVLTSAVRIMLSARKPKTFADVLREKLDQISTRYGALIEPDPERAAAEGFDGVYLIASNVDAIFTAARDEWGSLDYNEKFAFSEDFPQTKKIYFYVNHVNMTARADRTGDDLKTTARLLARDTAVAIQRGFSDVVTAHALEITQEAGRAVVTIAVKSTQTADDAERIADVIDYMLFLHYVAT